MCFIQQPGERLLLILLIRDMNRRELKSRIFHSLSKSPSDPQRIYSGWDSYCFLFILQVGEGLLTSGANCIQNWNLVVSCNPSCFLFLVKLNPQFLGLNTGNTDPVNSTETCYCTSLSLGMPPCPREHQAGAETAPGSVLVLQGQDWRGPEPTHAGSPQSSTTVSIQGLGWPPLNWVKLFSCPELGCCRAQHSIHCPFCSQPSWQTSAVWLKISSRVKKAPKITFLYN